MMSSGEEYSLRKHLAVLKARRKWIVACTLAAGLSTGLFSFFQPRIFGAKTLILVSESRTTDPDSKVSSLTLYEGLRTYKTLLFNDSVIEKAIEKFKLQQPPYHLSVERFRRDDMLQVSLQKNTPLLEVDVEFPEPHLAADIANFFATEAVGLNEKISATDREKTVQFLQKEMKRALQDLESSNKRLVEFNKTSRIEATREWVRNLLGRIAEDEANLTRLKVKLAGCQSERQGLSNRSRTYTPEMGASDASPLGQPSQMSPADDAALSSQLISPEERPSRVAGHLQDLTLEASSQVLSLTGQINALEAALRENNRKLDRLMQEKAVNEGVLGQLSLESKLCTEDYAAVSKKFREASMSVNARTIDLRQMSPALPYERPIKPRIPLNILLGATFGFLASTFVILLFVGEEKMKEDSCAEKKLREVRRSNKGQ